MRWSHASGDVDLKRAVEGQQTFRYGADFVEYDLMVKKRRLTNGTDAPL